MLVYVEEQRARSEGESTVEAITQYRQKAGQNGFGSGLELSFWFVEQFELQISASDFSKSDVRLLKFERPTLEISDARLSMKMFSL